MPSAKSLRNLTLPELPAGVWMHCNICFAGHSKIGHK
jgi:hypothetical protein